MKRKLLFLLAALLTSVGMWAAYTDFMTAANGWTKITTKDQFDALTLSDYYFALVAAEDGTDLIVTTRSYGNSTNYLEYLPAKDPRFDTNKLFMLASFDSGYSMQVASLPTRYFQSASGSAYDFIIQTDYTSASSYFTLSFSDEKLTIQNQYSYDSGNYFGPWNNTVTAGDRIAGNKQDGSKGTFYLYAIPRSYQQDIIRAAIGGNTQDVSFLLPDAKVELTKGFSPWTDINPMGGSETEGFCPEHWAAAGFTMDTHQTITVPNGKYELTVNGFYRYGEDYDATNQDPKLYANSANTYLPSISKETINRPTSHSEAAIALNSNRYLSDAVQTTVTNSSLKIEIKKEGTPRAKEWMVFDNFTLKLLDLCVSSAATELTDGNMEADTWYYVDVATAGLYSVSATTLSDIVYTTDGTTLTSAEVSATFSSLSALQATRYYVKSSSEQTLTINYAVDADVTSLYITNPSFEGGWDGNNVPEGWSLVIGSGGTQSNRPDEKKKSGRLVEGGGDWYFAYWTDSPNSSEVKQTVYNLPAGKYKLSAYVVTSAGTTITLAADGTSNTAVAPNGNAFKMEKYFTVGSAKNLEIAIGTTSSQAWYNMDDVHLVYNPAWPELTAVEGTMNSTVEDAQTSAIDAYENNQTTSTLNAALNAIAAARASVAYYDEAYNILNKASKLDAAGQASYAANETVAAIQSAYDGRTLTSVTSDQKTACNAAYIAAVKAQNTAGADMTDVITNPSFEDGEYTTGWSTTAGSDTGRKLNSDEKYAMSGVDGYYLFNTWASGSVGQPISQTLSSMPAGYYRLTAVMATDAEHTLQLTINSGTPGEASSVDKGTGVSVTVTAYLASAGNMEISAGTSGNYWYKADDFRLTYLGDASANLRVNDGKLGTFIAPFNVTLPENVKAYSAVADESKVTLTKIAEGGVILAAGTPVIIYGDGVSVNETFYGVATETENVTVNALTGILDNSNKTVPEGAYVLQTQTIEDVETQAFYKLASAATGALNRCYVTAESGVTTARLAISIDEETAINAIEAAETEAGVLKDGKFLIGGKIVVVKNGVKYSVNGQKLN